jgi:quercetin dioxygenase-like cupin family protein
MGDPGRHEDDRGVIRDLLVTPLDAVTEIRTYRGKIRGNHTHRETVQYTYVVSGMLRVVTQRAGGPLRDRVYVAGDMACEHPGVTHAWEALEDTVVLVFTKGPRSGAAYESDTFRLPEAERLIP